MTAYLFVYGTLRRDSPLPMAKLLERHTTLVGPGKVAGRLYQLEAYPGLVDAAGPDDWVHGQVLSLQNPDEILPVLDDYEGCAAGLFERRQVEVAGVMAWAYFWRGAVDEGRHIASGKYSK